jgi:hypothetical protein
LLSQVRSAHVPERPHIPSDTQAMREKAIVELTTPEGYGLGAIGLLVSG